MKLIIEFLNHLIPYGHYGYLIMFGTLLACGFGFPMPEDVVLITGGILSARGITDFSTTFAVCMAGVLVGDGVVFTIGRKMGPRIKETRFFNRMMTPEREKQVMRWFSKYGDKVIFFARFAPGLRMPLFLTAGMYQVSPWKFLALDGFAAIISVPVWIWVGYIFGANLETLEAKIQQFQLGIYSIVGGLLVIILATWYVKKKIKMKASES